MKYTLADALDKYLMNAGVDRKKYFVRHLAITGDVWSDLFVNTLNATKSVWQTINQDSQGLYIDVPCDSERIFYVSTEDKCNNLVPLYFNGLFNVIPQPTTKKCGCKQCNCSGLCEELNSTNMTTKVIFTQNGIDYIEKKWIQVCPNGDVLEYRETPVKKFNDRIGDGGDYNADYNGDYNRVTGFGNYEIITQSFQERICKLDVHPCGCPVSTIDNENLVLGCCGAYLCPTLTCCKKRSNVYLQDGKGKVGEAKISECGTKMYVRGLKTEVQYLLLTYQSDGRGDYAQNPVPEKALMALWTGIDFRKKMFNNAYSWGDKEAARIAHVREVNLLIGFDNKLPLKKMAADYRW